MHQLFPLAFQQSCQRDSRPAGYDFGNLVFGDLLAQQTGRLLAIGHLFLGFAQLALQLGYHTVPQLGNAVQVVCAFGFLAFLLRLLQLLADLAHLFYRLLLCFPSGSHCVRFRPGIGQFLAKRLEPFLAGLVLLFLQRGFFDLETHDLAGNLVQLRRHGIDLRANRRARFVHQVNCLVREKPVADVSVRQYRGGHKCGVLYSDSVVQLETLFQPPQDGNRVFHRRRINQDGLKAPLERGIFLYVPAVFVQRCGADAMQLAARQHGFQHVAGIRRALCPAGADNRVNFVYEKDHATFRRLDLVQDRFQSLFEFSAILCACHERGHVQGEDCLVLQSFRNIPAQYPVSQPLDNGRLADAGIAYQHRVVLCLAREYSDHAPDFRIPSYHRVQFSLPCQRHEVDPVFLQGLVCALGIVRGYALVAAYVTQCVEHGLPVHSEFVQNRAKRRPGALVGKRKQQVLDRDVFVLEPRRLVTGGNQHAIEAVRDIDLAGFGRFAAHARPPVNVFLDTSPYCLH